MWEELTQLNQRLDRAAEHKARVEKLQNRVKELEQEVKDTTRRVAQLKTEASREEQDVQRLEGLSLTGLFLTLLGSKEERLLKERQEAVAAQLKLDEATQRLQALQRDLEKAQYELRDTRFDGEDYNQLMRQKEALMAASPERGAAELLQFAERERELQRLLKELEEARSAGREADAALSRVGDSLDSAGNWGTWDMLGGGMIATAVKHSHIDDARMSAAHAQHALAAFQRELKDITVHAHVGDVSVDGFTKFADFFFDGLIADWVVQNQISASREQVHRARGQVGSLLYRLDERLRQTREELNRLTGEKQFFIAQFQR